jgi:LmbE family N-acetylglucosaminyl deacetylase
MKVLAIGAHPDDIEICCGGTILKHVAAGHKVQLLVLTHGEKGNDGEESSVTSTRQAEAKAGAAILGAELELWDYRDTEVPDGYELVARIEQVVDAFQPDRVYIPFGNDTHQDHRATSNAAKSACRKVKQILEYEEPSSYNSFTPNFWIDITPHIERKLKAIKAHESQGHKEILKAKSIEGLNLYRGYQSQVEYAEGFATFRYLET